MDRIKLIAVLCAGVVASQALAQQHSKPMRNPQSAAERQAMQTEQEKIRRFKTDEGEMGQTRWTEYTVNPAAKGEGTLVLVLGGRDSLGSSSPPDELPSLIAYAKTQVKGKVVFIVGDGRCDQQESSRHGKPRDRERQRPCRCDEGSVREKG